MASRASLARHSASSSAKAAQAAVVSSGACWHVPAWSVPGQHSRRQHRQQEQVRHYAAPVNPSSSVDAFLGTSVPLAPRPLTDAELESGASSASSRSKSDQTTPPNAAAAEELAQILKGNFSSKGSTTSNGRRRFSREDLTGANGRADPFGIRRSAILAELKGTAIPRDQREDVPPKEEQKRQPESKEKRIVDREHPHPIDAMNGRNELDERILSAAKALHHLRRSSASSSATLSQQKTLDIPTLLHQFETKAYLQLAIELPSEPTPSVERRAPLTSALSSTDAGTESPTQSPEEDGVLLVAYVSGTGAGMSTSASKEVNRGSRRGQERISLCSGFAVQGGEHMHLEDEGVGAGRGALMITCAHTLKDSRPPQTSSTSVSVLPGAQEGQGEESDSVAFAVTRSGSIYPIVKLVSSLPSCDLVLYQLAEQPLKAVDVTSALLSQTEASGPATTQQQPSSLTLRTLPISPYPAPTGTELAVSSFWGWEDDAGSVLPAWYYDDASASQSVLKIDPSPPSSPSGRDKQTVAAERDDAVRSRWGRARLVEYKDRMGLEARTGTYDDLHQMDFKLLTTSPDNPPALQSPSSEQQDVGAGIAKQEKRKGVPSFPPPGSSGGPVVDVQSGSVVGVVRGTKMGVLEGKRGDGIPAEKLFEFFALPGMGEKIRNEREAMKKRNEELAQSAQSN